MTPPRIVVTQDDAITAMTDKTKRTFVPIRKTFVQQGTGKIRAPGPAGVLCTNRDERGLDLYLLVHMVTSGDDFTTTMDAAGWARGLGLSPTPNGLAAVSKTFARLDTRGLLRRDRSGNRGRYTLLDESGSSAPYVHPAGRNEPYLKLPHAYWTDGWHHRLSLTGKTLLLISLSLSPDFVLTRRVVLPRQRSRRPVPDQSRPHPAATPRPASPTGLRLPQMAVQAVGSLPAARLSPRPSRPTTGPTGPRTHPRLTRGSQSRAWLQRHASRRQAHRPPPRHARYRHPTSRLPARPALATAPHHPACSPRAASRRREPHPAP